MSSTRPAPVLFLPPGLGSVALARVRRAARRAESQGLPSIVIDVVLAARITLRPHDPDGALVQLDADRPLFAFRLDLDNPPAALGPLHRRWPSLAEDRLLAAVDLLVAVARAVASERDRTARRIAARRSFDRIDLPSTISVVWGEV